MNLMKKISLLIILSLFALNTSSWAQLDTFPNDLGEKISTPEGLKKAIDSKDPRHVIVDVRPKISYNMGHIPTAICILNGFISYAKNPPPKGKYVIIYCSHGIITPAAGERILADGYKYVFDWSGIKDWPYELEILNSP